MAYDGLTGRTQAGALVPPEHSNEIIKMATESSAALSMLKRVPIMTNQKTFPVLSTLPAAYWIAPTATDPQGPAQTTTMTWENVTMNAEDMAVVLPFPRRVLEDIGASGINLTDEVKPALAEAAGILLDQAIFFGTNIPSSWPSCLQAGALAAVRTGDVKAPSGKNMVVEGTNAAAKGGLAGDINLLLRIMAAQGYRPSALFARSTFEFDLDNTRDTTGQKLLDLQNGTFGGRPIMFGGDGVFPAEGLSVTDLFVFDPSKFILGLRKEMEITVHTEGVITDASGLVKLNLFQQDQIALRLIMRVGYAVANPVNRMEATKADRFPAGVLQSPAS